MTTDEAIKALQGEPIPDWQPTITTTGALPTAYMVLYEKVLAETVDVEPEVQRMIDENFMEMFEPLDSDPQDPESMKLFLKAMRKPIAEPESFELTDKEMDW